MDFFYKSNDDNDAKKNLDHKNLTDSNLQTIHMNF